MLSIAVKIKMEMACKRRAKKDISHLAKKKLCFFLALFCVVFHFFFLLVLMHKKQVKKQPKNSWSVRSGNNLLGNLFLLPFKWQHNLWKRLRIALSTAKRRFEQKKNNFPFSGLVSKQLHLAIKRKNTFSLPE